MTLDSRPRPSPEEMEQTHEEALAVDTELREVLGEGRYTKVQETAVSIARKREFARTFHEEMERALAELPEGQNPTMLLNEKAVANLYMAGHLFGKDFTMRHIVQCLLQGKEVTQEMKHAKEGSRYFRLDKPEGAGMPGRFVLPKEDGTPLAEHVANWNQECESRFRHGQLSSVIKKRDLPSWLIEYESVFFVIVEKNTLPNGELQVKDGSTEKDPEGDWLISTVHYGNPSRIKPRPPRGPKWEAIKSDPAMLNEALIQYNKAVQKYFNEHDEWSDEQRRVVFVDLEEEGVGQQGVKKGTPVGERKEITDARTLAEVVEDNTAVRKMLEELKGQMQQLQSKIKGLDTRQKK